MAAETPESSRPSPFRERRKVIVAVALLALATGAFETATIVAIVAFIEGVTSGDLAWEITTGPLDLSIGRGELVVFAVVALVGATVGQSLITWLKARAVAHWQYAMQMRAMSSFVRAGWSTQSSRTSGSLQNLMSLAWGSAQGLLGLMNLLAAGGALLVMSAGAFVASPLAAGALLATGVVLMVALRPLRSAAREATHRATVAQLAVSEGVGEIHDLAQEIRVHGAGDAVLADVRRAGRRLRRERATAGLLTGMGAVMYRSLGLGLVLVAAILASRATDIDVARVGVAGLLLLRSLSYGQGVQAAWQTIENNKPYVDQLGEALAVYEESVPRRGNRRVDDLGDVELRGVSYAYGDASPDVLRGIDLQIRRGETLGIVGPSGSGKSTLAQILLGLREPTGGMYLVGADPATEIAEADWFRLVTVVPQQPQLLRASVLDNIVFHRSGITAGDAEQAAVAAGLHDEILALPDGYRTPIGDAVRDLSGGQRQRLGIARALAGSPQLLVLDEPTSALDAMSEARIQETLTGLRGKVTVVIIAHRLATLNHCDRLLVLEGGTVRALDTPQVVMQQNDFYRSAAKMQLVATGEGT